MNEPWRFAGEPGGGVGGGTLPTLVEGSTFCISDARGDITAGGSPQGLFVRDTRVLSEWQLLVNNQALAPLNVQRDEPFAATFISRIPPAIGESESTLLVTRRRFVGDGLREDITVRNTSTTPHATTVTMIVNADFADLFEVKDQRAREPDDVVFSTDETTARLTCRRGDQESFVSIVTDPFATISRGAIAWHFSL
ncbi:MAG TPA: glycogen debranching N-terminal domain-containing protein, partial [Jatrophihabitantaceae bacterium]|nr:glycogen debranching N-terminal domain-containing protein [Jatrophihabitantaceae bacterium]